MSIAKASGKQGRIERALWEDYLTADDERRADLAARKATAGAAKTAALAAVKAEVERQNQAHARALALAEFRHRSRSTATGTRH